MKRRVWNHENTERAVKPQKKEKTKYEKAYKG